MENVLEVRKLRKKYDSFELQDISLDLPRGSIMGFVGQNGAGKTTAIKLILNLIRADAGEIKIFGEKHNALDRKLKEQIGVVFDECNFPEYLTAKDIILVMKNIYRYFQVERFDKLLDSLKLPKNNPIKEFSRGMKMKLSIAVALSHGAKLLILDEPTSGLDPIVRDEVLDLFLEFIQDEDCAILVSSHIISDLEKVADYITFIHEGKIIFSENKDRLLEEYGVLKCSHHDFEQIDKTKVLGYRENQFSVAALIRKKDVPKGFLVEQASIEEIMLFMTRGERAS